MIFNLNYNDNNWSRLGLTLAGTHELVKIGRQKLIETNADAASGFRNTIDEKAGGKLG